MEAPARWSSVTVPIRSRTRRRKLEDKIEIVENADGDFEVVAEAEEALL